MSSFKAIAYFVKLRAAFCLLLLVFNLAINCSVSHAVESLPDGLNGAVDFSQQYTALTKKIMLAGIELERFSLNYRLEGPKQPKFRRLRYFLAQETGAAGGLAFEITELDQFGKGRKNPLKINKSALHAAFATAVTTSIIAGSGSCLELSLNMLQAMKNKQHGFDSHSANKYVVVKLKQIDELLSARESIVSSHPNHPAYSRAVIEGKILREMGNAFIQEYSEFNADTKSYLAFQNTFFLLNIAYNAVLATAAGEAYRGVTHPQFNGTANILFIVGGALAASTPLISNAIASLVRKQTTKSLAKQLKANPNFDLAMLSTQRQKLEELLPSAQGVLIPSLPATQRLALYTESDHLFRKQLANETKIARHLEKVALQSSILAPIIGGTLMTQGILGTVGYYKYPLRIRKQINQYYNGAIVGTVGAGMAVVGNAAWLLASWSYENHLKKHNRLPAQLIKQRLEHLDQLEITVNAI